ncbi:hypothetical protein N7508_008000 [Penicillium antarcticum]|uniref:uncharacterized protein n=1 Tax=Penicillium antarcticum TaxID=416450 RepID=UPI0023A0E5FE|nr:uncharacterized protein N7508_008000 [Penicillium antarcticum]KAJ5297751.1 hypothetical protein N7508_008000 [Penicillium antarcticum]
MAEQSNRDVVDQTLSGGEPSPSDVPASTNDNLSAGGDAGKTEHIAMNNATSNNSRLNQQNHETTDMLDSRGERTGSDKDPVGSVTDNSKQGAGVVATRVLELNGIASASDGGDDTASQGGSESDASRTDSRNHARSGSVKKPGSFKPVSFAKFSVPKVAGAPTPPKAPEKVPSASSTPLGTPQPSSRPRLVAKTTAGMRDSFSKTGAGGGNTGGSGPDPNQVWNKNRPVQPPPPKHLTDEELKQQYGIHMTSRIQEDGAVSSEAKWADIDDDEDDWAPETIEWTDGTKVTLTHTDPPPAPNQPEPKEAPSAEHPPATKEPLKFAPKPTTSIGPNPTILKLGANAERQARTASASSKGTNDNVQSSSTSPAPPSKSPWATLPPVERVSPVSAPMQPPPHQLRMPMSHSQGPRDEGYHGQLPPKEIAADDFNRTWKDTQSGAPRELYNSRSGRYEPVADTRRPSWRPDQHPRAPAVLQRANEHSGGPAEPSAAFQTHRSSHQDGPGWGRRRTSSNVSGGSGGYGRRMSFGRPDAPPRFNDVRRGSQVNGMVDPALIDREQPHGKDEMHSSGPNGTARSVVDVGDSPAEAQVPVPQIPQEDPVAMQERIMKEKRLEARQRRIEQEEKEDAAKRERIRQRLEAMGPAPEKKIPENRNSHSQSHQQTHPLHHPPPPSPSQLHHHPASAISSPPKPPVPEPSGEPKQYGMMKVHHPDSVKKLVASHDRERTSDKHHPRHVPSPNQQKRDHPSAPGGQDQTESQSPVQNKADTKPEEQHGPQWRANLNVSHSPWSTNPNIGVNPPSVNNPWKPLGSDRTLTLGNGIFDQPLGFASREVPLRSQLGLDQATMPAPNFPGPQEPNVPTLPSPETKHPSLDKMTPIGHPRPIGPPSSQQNHAAALKAWNNFHEVAAKQEAEDARNFMAQFKEKREKGITRPIILNETWNQVRVNEDGSRKVIKTTERTHSNVKDTVAPSNPLTELDTPADGFVNAEPNARTAPTRSSRFFPQGTEQQKRQVTEKERSPSPPPPEEMSSHHPVYFGDSDRPLVHLPTPKPPKPVVKLPPKAAAAATATATVAAPAPAAAAAAPAPSFASMAAAPPRKAAPSAPSAPSASNAVSWQAKFDDLFGKSTPPDRKSVLAVTSASKEPLPVHVSGAAVSLPRVVVDSQPGDGDLAVRQVEEQDEMFEDREPGSLPAVRVPPMAPPMAWAPVKSRYKNTKPVNAQSLRVFLVGANDIDHHGNTRVTIRVPGGTPTQVLLPRKAGTLTPRHHNPANPSKPRKTNNKSRDAAGGGPKKSGPQGSSQGTSGSRYRGWSPETK